MCVDSVRLRVSDAHDAPEMGGTLDLVEQEVSHVGPAYRRGSARTRRQVVIGDTGIARFAARS